MYDLADNRQKQDALLRVFFIFVAMTLLLIRAVPLARGPSGLPLAATSPEEHGAITTIRAPHVAEPIDLYEAAVALLFAAEAAVERMFRMAQELYEILGQRDAVSRSANSLALIRHRQLTLSPQPIDSS